MNPTTSFLAAVALSSASYALADDSSSDSVSEQDLLNQAIRSDQMMTDDEFHSTQSESLNALGYRSISTNSSFEELRQDDSISQTNFYDSPYRVSLFNPQNGEDSERLWSQTKSIFAYGVGVAGVLALMPESITNWEKDDIKLMNKWWDNVRSGPVWDRDDHVINYIGHPYFGGVYYQAARKSGYRQWDAFMYSTLMSTFYWEYGIEAFAEVPSIQDLVVTPTLGWYMVNGHLIKRKKFVYVAVLCSVPMRWVQLPYFS
ncbi:ubiquitin-protein ligase [Vibrio maritimus]|uniref:Ubiquitin-protein ligase n=1 Tax=Vibrio maritimus TaxID=990268 RepID=A0A090RRW8_9VIBR|nr:ubiquitin-protein ligase [Vibrio maritimus]